jgi:hypothetical protein
MTEPLDPRTPDPSIPAPSPESLPAEPAPAGWVPPHEPAAVPPPTPTEGGWTAPEPAGRSRLRTGCIIGCLAVAAVVVVGFIGLVFLGGQILDMFRGSVQFGTSGTECNVTGTASTFSTSQQVHVVAYFERQVTTGETADLVVTFPDGTSQSDPQSFAEATDCLYLEAGPGLDPGRYVIEVRTDAEVLARGEMDITP